jgi:hypothetical protein
MLKNPELNRKLVSLLLIVGGTAGVIATLWTEMSLISRANRGAATVMGVFALIFGLSTWTGIELWRKKPWAFTCAQILLIAQIPNISFPGFAYYFYTGFTLYLSLNTLPSVLLGFEFQLGSALRLEISHEIEGFTVGLNLVAIVALYLLGKSRVSIKAKEEVSLPTVSL